VHVASQDLKQLSLPDAGTEPLASRPPVHGLTQPALELKHDLVPYWRYPFRPAPTDAHAWGEHRGSPDDLETYPAANPLGPKTDYIRVLSALLKLYNDEHSTKRNLISFKTRGTGSDSSSCSSASCAAIRRTRTATRASSPAVTSSTRSGAGKSAA
jgi:hypothetical protein